MDVLCWVCPAFCNEVKSVYENFVVEQNAVREAQASNPESALTKRNVRFMDETMTVDYSKDSEDTEMEEEKLLTIEQLE